MDLLSAWHLYLQGKALSLRDGSVALGSRGRILLSFIALVHLYAYTGDVLIYLAPSKTWGYALKYGVADSRVAIDKRPYNCEWGTAPLGDKHCHYEAQVQWTKIAVAADGVTPLISFDGGRTWTENTAHLEPSKHSASRTVSVRLVGKG
jgi:hypothetical protein